MNNDLGFRSRKISERVNKKAGEFNFAIKDFDSTRYKHRVQIQRIKDSTLTFKEIIDNCTEDSIVSNILNSNYWMYNIGENIKKPVSKTDLRTLKQLVNSFTWKYIQNALDWYNKPKSWSTAFYVSHYKRINQMMTRITKTPIKDHLREV